MMITQVDFYVFQQSQEDYPWQFMCKLIEKIYKKNLPLWVYCASFTQAQTLDNLLWTYDDTSFLPHTLQSAEPNTQAPIVISDPSYPPPSPMHSKVLFNLSETIPVFDQPFSRIVEIVLPHAPSKAKSREIFRAYQRQGYSIKTHPM